MSARVATRYARALFELAEDKHLLDPIHNDLHDFAKLLDQEKLLRLLFYSIEEDEQEQQTLVEHLLHGKTDIVLLNFLKLLIQRRRQNLLSDIISEFDRLMDNKENRVRVTVTSAHALATDELHALRQRLETLLAATVVLDTHVDSDLLGGMLLNINGTVIDNSLRRQLDELQEQLSASSHARV